MQNLTISPLSALGGPRRPAAALSKPWPMTAALPLLMQPGWRRLCETFALVRKHNPYAVIVWAYGMLGSGLLPLLRDGLDQYRTVSGDERVYLLELPEARGDTISARQHPGAAAHRAAANCLAEFLCSVL